MNYYNRKLIERTHLAALAAIFGVNLILWCAIYKVAVWAWHWAAEIVR